MTRHPSPRQNRRKQLPLPLLQRYGVLYVFCGCAILTSLSATTTSLHASHRSLSSNTQSFLLFSSKLIVSKYRTGKTLGSGTYAIVKEAIHVETGKYFACKVINKKLMEGREHMVLSLLFLSSLSIDLTLKSIRSAMRSQFSNVFQVVIAISSLFTITSRSV